VKICTFLNLSMTEMKSHKLTGPYTVKSLLNVYLGDKLLVP